MRWIGKTEPHVAGPHRITSLIGPCVIGHRT
jgi:hypothetical protein